MIFKDSGGRPLSSDLIAAAKRQQGDALRELMQSTCDEINVQVDALRTLHNFAPRPTDHPVYRATPCYEPPPGEAAAKDARILRQASGGARRDRTGERHR